MNIDGEELMFGDRILITGIPIAEQVWWRRVLHRLHIRRLHEPMDQNGIYTTMASSEIKPYSIGFRECNETWGSE